MFEIFINASPNKWNQVDLLIEPFRFLLNIFWGQEPTLVICHQSVKLLFVLCLLSMFLQLFLQFWFWFQFSNLFWLWRFWNLFRHCPGQSFSILLWILLILFLLLKSFSWNFGIFVPNLWPNMWWKRLYWRITQRSHKSGLIFLIFIINFTILLEENRR